MTSLDDFIFLETVVSTCFCEEKWGNVLIWISKINYLKDSKRVSPFIKNVNGEMYSVKTEMIFSMAVILKTNISIIISALYIS